MSNTSGFLSKEDRRFLRGEKEYTGEYASQNRYERRKAIAERARKAFGDFALLHETLDRAERNRIFDVGPNEAGPAKQALRAGLEQYAGEEADYSPSEGDIQRYIDQKEARAELRENVAHTLAFLYDSLEGEPGAGAPSDRGFPYDFETVLQGAVVGAERKRRELSLPTHAVEVRFTVDVHAPDVDYQYAAEKFARYEQNELTESELRGLLSGLMSDLPTVDDFAQFGDLHDFAEKVDQRREELEEEREE